MNNCYSRWLPIVWALLGGLLISARMANAQTADFRPLVREALQKGEKHIVIAPGTYRLAPEAGQGVIWTLRSVRDVKIVADDVKLIGTKLTRAVMFDRCTNVTLQGLTIDYDPLPFTQGTVVAVADDQSWIDVKIHDGYPKKPYARIDVVDPQTRFRKKGMPFLWGTKAAMSAPDTVRVTLKDIGKTAVVGDFASLSTGPEAGGIPHALTVENCADITLRDVTLHTAPGMGIVEVDGEGRAQYLGCKIVRGPLPEGATQERLLTTTWDAMQSKTIKHGPRVENCEIEDAGDDSWSVQSSDYLILKRDGRNITLASRDEYTDGVQIGDHVRTSLDGPEAIVTTRKAVSREAANLAPDILEKLNKAAPWTLWNVGKKCLELTLDRESPFQVGDSVFSPDRQGNGFTFRLNRVHSPGRILIKAGGLIENNTFDTPHNITVSPEVPGEAAAGIKDLIIRNNQILNAGYFCPAPWSSAAGAISVTAGAKAPQLRPAGVFQNIVIANNTIMDCNGPNLVVSSARNVTVRDNIFMNPHHVKPNNTGASYQVDLNAAAWISETNDINWTKNAIINPGPFMKKEIGFTSSVKNFVQEK